MIPFSLTIGDANMATVTLAESAKLSQDMLIAGLIETIIEVNPIFDVMPFTEIEGNALAYNRELVLGDAQFAGVGGTITAKSPATFTRVVSELTTIIGDAEVNGLIQATRSGDGNDQKAVQIASKAKSCGRKYQDQMINGDGTGANMTGDSTPCRASRLCRVSERGLGRRPRSHAMERIMLQPVRPVTP